MNTQNLNALFKAAGLKTTQQRAMIYRLLEQSPEPIAANRIFTALNRQDDSLSLSTVYRILEIFVVRGLVAKHTLQDDTKALYELAQPEHRHYLVCRQCRKMTELGHCPFGALQKTLEQETGYVIEDHRLEVIGLCPECARKKD